MTRCSVEPASSAFAACCHADGGFSSRSKAASTKPPLKSAGKLRIANQITMLGTRRRKRGRRRANSVDAAVANAPAPRARPRLLNGRARVLLRSASDSDDRDELATPDINGDGLLMGWTPTARTMPTNTSIAAYLRWLQRVSAMPAMQQASKAKP